MNSCMREDLKNTKKIFKIMEINYIDAKDKKIIKHVSKSLKNIQTSSYICEGNANYLLARYESLENLKILGNDIYNKASKTISTIGLVPFFDVRNGYACNITYKFNDVTSKVVDNSGTVNHYKVPKNPDSMASIHLGHEHIHAIKETNYNEYKDAQIFGDVLPILYELILSETYPDKKLNILNFRFFSLKEDLKLYENAIMEMKKSRLDKDLYKVVATRSGQYLNSFYYAILLFNIYKTNPRIILELMNKVLNHKMTTKEMLDSLGILHDLNNDIYNFELEEIKKCIKK